MLEHEHKWNYLWQKWYFEHEDAHSDIKTILQGVCDKDLNGISLHID